MEKNEKDKRRHRGGIDRLNGKEEEVRKEVSVRPKNRAEGGISWNGIERVILNNVRARIEEGIGNQGEWIKVKEERSKKIPFELFFNCFQNSYKIFIGMGGEWKEIVRGKEESSSCQI